MPRTFDPTLDPTRQSVRDADDPGILAALVTPSDAANLPAYAKSLRVYVPATISEATVRVTPLNAADDADTLTLKFSSGLVYEPLAVRKVWATGTTAGIEIHAYTG